MLGFGVDAGAGAGSAGVGETWRASGREEAVGSTLGRTRDDAAGRGRAIAGRGSGSM
jgi:hypothetical protein